MSAFWNRLVGAGRSSVGSANSWINTSDISAPASAVTTSNAPTVNYTVDNVASVIPEITNTAQYNNAYNASEAKKLRLWQEKQNTKAMEFNAIEAAKNRDWQQMMSNTAHQREIADLKAAGLNPVLSAMNGNGAAVTSGATASGVTSAGAKGEADTTANSAIVTLLGSLLNAQTQLANQAVAAQTQMAIADKQAATSELVALLSGSYSERVAQIGLAGVQAQIQGNLDKMYAEYGQKLGLQDDAQAFDSWFESKYPRNEYSWMRSTAENATDAAKGIFSSLTDKLYGIKYADPNSVSWKNYWKNSGVQNRRNSK